MQELTADGLLAALRGWVEIESPTQDVAAVGRMADHVEAKLRAIGALIERTPGRDGFGDILIGRIAGEQPGPGLLLLGHIDTVHPVGTLAGKLPFRVEGSRAYGPGIYDMKGGNAMALAALEHLHAQGRKPRLPVSFMMIPDEEAGSPSSRAAIEAEALRHAAVLVPEPSGEGGRLTVGRHGIARYHLRTIGRPAHAGATHAEGRSAIREMARQILTIEALTDYPRNLYVNIGTISGGTHENMVPAECRAICYALVPTAAEARELHDALLALRPHDPDVALEVVPGLSRPPFGKTPAIQALYDHAKALAADGAFPVAGERIAAGGSDGNFTGALGVPTLDGLGVIGGGPHSFAEHIEIGCLVPRTRLFVRLFESPLPPCSGATCCGAARWYRMKAANWIAGAAVALGGAALANHFVAKRNEARRPPRGRFLTVDGVRLHFIERGASHGGPTLVLLHGNGAMAEDFALSGILDELGLTHHVIAFDRPGFGYSDRPRAHIWTAANQARLLRRALRRMGIQRAVLAGHSWGTLVALEMALQRPDQVAALVLMSGYFTPTLRMDVPAFSGPAIPVLGDTMRYTISPLIAWAITPLLFRRIFAPGPVPPHFAEGFPTGLALRPSQIRASAADTALMVPAAIATRNRHGEVQMPVLILAGAEDRIADVGRQSARLHHDIPGSELRLVPGAGHMIHHAAPEAVVRAIRDAADRARDCAAESAAA